MKLPRENCATCGLRILQRVGGWEHFNTAAGRKAEARHTARPKGLMAAIADAEQRLRRAQQSHADAQAAFHEAMSS